MFITYCYSCKYANVIILKSSSNGANNVTILGHTIVVHAVCFIRDSLIRDMVEIFKKTRDRDWLISEN